MAKRITDSQMIGERGETAARLRFLNMGFQFDTRSRLEAGIDGIAEIMLNGRPLAQMIAVQVKATDTGRYANETDAGFTYLMKSEDLEYWKGTNLPIILLLYRIEDDSFYWKSVNMGREDNERKLQFDKANDILDDSAKDKLAALCVEKSGQGHFVPPLRGGEKAVINMMPINLPNEMYVSSTQCSGRQALAIILDDKPSARFDWLVFGNTVWSFHDPREESTSAIVDLDQVDAIETDMIANHEDEDHRHQFSFLLRKALDHAFEGKLRWNKDKRLFYIPAKQRNTPVKFSYKATAKNTASTVVSVQRKKADNAVSYVRHHAFIPRFERLNGQWHLIVTPTYHFTVDGFIPHSYPDALLSGKKRLETNAALRGQVIMWHRFLTQNQIGVDSLFAATSERSMPLQFGELPEIMLPQTVPELAWENKSSSLMPEDGITEASLFDVS